MLWFFWLVALGHDLVHLVEFGGNIKIELPSVVVLLVDVLCEYPHALQNQKTEESYDAKVGAKANFSFDAKRAFVYDMNKKAVSTVSPSSAGGN